MLISKKLRKIIETESIHKSYTKTKQNIWVEIPSGLIKIAEEI